jgi:hypothetical protein
VGIAFNTQIMAIKAARPAISVLAQLSRPRKRNHLNVRRGGGRGSWTWSGGLHTPPPRWIPEGGRGGQQGG